MAEDTIDPVTLAVLKGRLEQIADEMDATLYLYWRQRATLHL